MKGQTQIITTAITAVAMLIGAYFTSWTTASNRTAAISERVAIVETESKQYREDIKSINTKLFLILTEKVALLPCPNFLV